MTSTCVLTKKTVKIVLFPGCQILDISGPIAVLEGANRVLPENLGYDLSVVAEQAGVQQTSGCLKIEADAAFDEVDLDQTDLLIVPGGWPGTEDAMKDRALLALIRGARDKRVAIASICTGAFVLAAAGVLEGHSCTTHWSDVDKFQKMFPDVSMITDVIFHRDAGIWTSAGVSTGIDMTLAMVAHDFGLSLSNQVAKNLVLFAARPAQQKQVSDLLKANSSTAQRLHDLVLYVNTHPNLTHTVPSMSEHCSMSPRNFTRRFKEEFDMSPAAMVRNIRIARARYLLENSNYSAKNVAKLAGFASVSVMRQSLNATPEDGVISIFS